MTVSYSVDFPNLPNREAGWKPSMMIVDRAHTLLFPEGYNIDKFFVTGTTHNFHVMVKLQSSDDVQGRVGATSNICRLYNNDDLADVELHCGSVVLKAHKEWLAYTVIQSFIFVRWRGVGVESKYICQ